MIQPHPMRWATVVVALVPLLACKLSDTERDGPSPAPSALSRTDATFPTEAVLCTTSGGSLRVAGSGFSPMPIDTLTEEESLAIPKVRAVGGGATVELPVSSIDVGAQQINVTVAANALAAGTYDLVIENPNGNTGTLPGALVVVPPPTVTAVNPAQAPGGQINPITVTGTGFRSAADATTPQIILTAVGTSTLVEATDEVLNSETEVAGSVPTTAAVGRYDVTVRNPEGCEATLPDAFEIVPANQIALCNTVTPAFGWVQSATTIEICASNADGKGLQSTPEVFIQINGEDVPLRREAYLTANDADGRSVMTAVVPSQSDNPDIVVGGPYTIRVVNPDGKSGLIPAAFTVLPDPPPNITAINPGRGDQGATLTLTVTGENFKPAAEAGPVLAVSLIAADGTETACGATTVTLDSPSAGVDTATCSMTLPTTTGGYVVRARHLDDGSFDDFALFAITEASAKLAQTTSVMPSLNTARRAHGMAIGVDDLGNRFLYVAGGENGSTAALASVEFASISTFGQLGDWTVATEGLPSGRTGVRLVSVGRYLYALGGSGDGSTPLTTDTVLRAQVLGSDSAPVLQLPTASSGGTLAAGTYYYRVSAVFAAGTVNPLGEGLASDMESVKVGSNGQVNLEWSMPAGAPTVSSYRIFRSPDPNLTAGTEVLIGTSATANFTDTGLTPAVEAAKPLPPGSISEWVAMPQPTTNRFDHGATAVRIDGDNVFLYISGGRSGALAADLLNSTDEAVLAADGSDLTSWRAGPNLTTARAEHIMRPVSHALAETVPEGTYGVVVAAGTNGVRGCNTGCGLTSLESSALTTSGGTTGAAIAFGNAGTLSGARVAGTGYVVNDFFYAFNGYSGTGGAFANASEKSDATSCTGGPPCAVSFTGFSAATVGFAAGNAFRSATEFYGAYFFFAGGSTGLAASTTTNVVQRVSY